MKNFLKILAVGTAFAASSTLAFAAPMASVQVGCYSISGCAVNPAIFVASTSSIYFTNQVDDNAPASAGDFSGVTSITLPSSAAQFSFVPNSSMTPTTLLTFSGVHSATPFTDNFVATSESFNAALDELDFQGYTTGTIDNNVAASVAIDALNGTGAFQLTLSIPPISPSPEPSSLVLLGTGLVSAAGMAFRRRRSIA